MSSGFLSMKDIIKKEPAFAGLRKTMAESDVVTEFHNIFPELIKVAAAVKVEKKVLYMRAESPAWRNELKFKESSIIEKINKFFGDERIKWIKFVS